LDILTQNKPKRTSLIYKHLTEGHLVYQSRKKEVEDRKNRVGGEKAKCKYIPWGPNSSLTLMHNNE